MRGALLLVYVITAVTCSPSMPGYGPAISPSMPGYGPASTTSSERPGPFSDGERLPTHSSCGDYAVLNDQRMSGGERLTVWTPCWDPAEGDLGSVADREEPDSVSDSQGEGLELRAEGAGAEGTGAEDDRATTGQLAGAQATVCRGLAVRDIERSPFSHKRAIVEVVPHREGGEIRGAHIVFEMVPGLTADWMRRAIACHQARYANLGKSDPYLPGDPTLVEGTTITVSQRGSQIDVLVTTDAADTGRIALSRAEALVGSRTATR